MKSSRPGMSGSRGWFSWPTARDHRLGAQRLGLAGLVADADLPDGVGLVEGRLLDLGLETDVSAQAVLLGDALEVGQQHRLRREVVRPLVVGLERVGIEVARIVDAAVRIAVLEPGAADVGVLLDDRERDAGLLQPDAGQQSRHAGADHHHRQLRRGGLQLGRRPVRLLGVHAGHLQLFHQERRVVLGDLRAGDEVHHLADGLEAWLRRQRRAGQVRLDRGAGGVAQLGLPLRRIAAQLGVAEEVVDRPAVAPDQAGVAGQVDQRGGQRRQVGGGQRLVEVGGMIGHGIAPLRGGL